MRRVLLAAALVAASVAANAREPMRALHNIAWYAAHAAERGATLRLCHSDYSFAGMPDCANAENAATGKVGSASSIERLRAMLNDPAYWRDNKVVRWAQMEQCRRRDPLAMPYCAAAAAGGGDAP